MEPSHHFLQSFLPLRMHKVVAEDTTHAEDISPYPKQLSLFCLLWLISVCADRNGYITNFRSMIKLLHELKNSSC